MRNLQQLVTDPMQNHIERSEQWTIRTKDIDWVEIYISSV